MWKPALCFVAVLPLGLARQARCDDSTLAQVNTIFDAVEGRDAKGKGSQGDVYTRLARLKPRPQADPRVQYAFLLGLIETRKHREAVELAADLVKRYPEYLPARSLRTRLLLKDHKFEEAFAELEALAQRLSVEQQSEDLSGEGDATCQLLGLAFGYLEGPGRPLFRSTLGEGIKDRVLMNLSIAQRRVFDQHYQMVEAEHRELIASGEKALEATRAKTQAEAKRAAEQKARLDNDKQKVEAIAEEARGKLQAEWDKASNEYAKIEASVAGTRARLTVLGNQRTVAGALLATLRQPVAHKDGSFDLDSLLQYNQNALKLQATLTSVDAQLMRNQADLQQALQRGVNLETQLSQIARDGERLGQQFHWQKRDILKQEKKIKAPADIKKSSIIKQKEQALATYDDFSYALEKQRLLTSLNASRRASP
jgi:hypothetical protein